VLNAIAPLANVISIVLQLDAVLHAIPHAESLVHVVLYLLYAHPI